MGRHDEDPGAPLIGPSSSLFSTDRPKRDAVWGWIWALALAGAVVGAVYAGQHA